MALEDIVKKSIESIGNHTYGLRSTAERIKAGQGPTDKGKFDDNQTALIINYTRDDIPDEYDGSFSDELEENVAIVNGLPEKEKTTQMNENLAKAYKTAREKLVKRVQPNYVPILDDLDGNSLFQLFMQAPLAENMGDEYKQTRDAKAEFEKWAQAVETKDTKVYTETISHPLIRKILEKYPDSELVQKFMKNRLAKAQYEFFEPYADVEKLQEAMKNKDKKAIGKAIKSDKVKAYLLANAEALPDEARTEIYETTGVLYSNYLAEKAKDKANAKTRKEFEEHGGSDLSLEA